MKAYSVTFVSLALSGCSLGINPSQWEQCPPPGVVLEDCAFPATSVRESKPDAEEKLDSLCNTSCRSVEFLNISLESDSIAAFKPITRFQRIQALTISDSPNLRDLRGLEGVTDLQTLRIERNDSLRSLAGLGSLSKTIQVTLDSNHALVDISPLQEISEIDEFVSNQQKSLSNFAPLSSLRKANRISIHDHPALKDLSFLTGLESLTRTLSIRDNASIEHLGEFPRLQSVPQNMRLEVIGNPKLPQCEAVALAQRWSVSRDGILNNDASASCD